jgi:nitroimidazol reductase NimA-like FMN-containing flavoprotein (pyridoxamine 5'-phosphate oxidase superfamily)
LTASNIAASGQYSSTVATGTAPFVVASSTVVTNLNADLLDGNNGAFYQNATNINTGTLAVAQGGTGATSTTGTGANVLASGPTITGTLTAASITASGQYTSTVATGTAPLVVASSTVVTNLNASFLEGNNAAFYRNATNINTGTLAVAQGGTGATSVTGTGANVLASGPTITGTLTTSNITASGQYSSTVATGTAPFVVASSTVVANLNASLLEGNNAAFYRNATNINTGTLAVAQGGTGATSTTGTGANVLASGPTITGTLTAASITASGQYTSTVATGTAPLVVASSTVVTNLNASFLEGNNAAFYRNATNINTGTLAVAQGGTGATSTTGTGANVLASGPTINNLTTTGVVNIPRLDNSGGANFDFVLNNAGTNNSRGINFLNMNTTNNSFIYAAMQPIHPNGDGRGYILLTGFGYSNSISVSFQPIAVMSTNFGIGVSNPSVPLQVAGNATISGQYTSTVATGTAPFVVTSSTAVANLNASFLEGNNAAFYRNATNINTGTLAVAQGGTGATSITGTGANVLASSPAFNSLAMNKTRLWIASLNDSNHAIYNNGNNLDNEGAFDGLKINANVGFWVRGGTAGGLNWMYANSTGVGIRHTNPTVALDVSGQIRAFNSNNLVETASTTSVTNGQTRLRLVGPGVLGSQVNSGGSNVQTRIEMQGYTTRNGGPSVILAGVGDGDWSQHFTISTAPAGGVLQSDPSAVERMRITNSGFVGIGTTNPQTPLHVNTTGSANILRISGDVAQDEAIEFFDTASRWYIYKPASGSNLVFQAAGVDRVAIDPAGNFTTTGDVTAFGSISDRRLKEHVTGLDPSQCLSTVETLNPVRFTWKDTCVNPKYIGVEDIGLIAQELEAAVPEAVQDTTMLGEEYKSIKYERIIPLLIGAIKELSRQNKCQKCGCQV